MDEDGVTILVGRVGEQYSDPSDWRELIVGGRVKRTDNLAVRRPSGTSYQLAGDVPELRGLFEELEAEAASPQAAVPTADTSSEPPSPGSGDAAPGAPLPRPRPLGDRPSSTKSPGPFAPQPGRAAPPAPSFLLVPLSAKGRVGRSGFWGGFVVLFGLGFVAGLVPVAGVMASLALIYPWVCLYSRRLHDMGRSGWLAAVPFGVLPLALIFIVVALSGPQATSDASAGIGLVTLLAMFVWFGFTVWVGAAKGQAVPNRFGPRPGESA